MTLMSDKPCITAEMMIFIRERVDFYTDRINSDIQDISEHTPKMAKWTELLEMGDSDDENFALDSHDNLIEAITAIFLDQLKSDI